MVTVVETDRHKFSDKAQHVKLYAADTVTGNSDAINSHHGKLHVLGYETAIGIGEISGHTLFRGFGRREALSTAAAGDDIWEGAAVTTPYPNQSVGEQIVFISTSASDAAAGAGIQQIEMHYLDAAGASFVETITLNGITAVNSVATNVRFIQYIHAIRVGSFGAKAVGTITAYKIATPATVYDTIVPGACISLCSARMVPAGKTFYLNYITVTGTSSKPLSLRVTATCDDDGVLTSGIFLFNEIFEIQDSTALVVISVPRKFPAFSVIKGIAISNTAGGACSVSYGGWLE